MSENKYTAEPWVVTKAKYVGGNFHLDKEGESDGNIATCYLDPTGANAKRIVDCVNALAGIDDVEGFMEKVTELINSLRLDDGESYEHVGDVVNFVNGLFPKPTEEDCDHQYSEIEDNCFRGYRNCIKCKKPINATVTLPTEEEGD